MARVKRGVASRASRKKVLKLAKGYYNRNKNCFRIAKQKVEKAGQYNYRDRKVRRREFRSLWIVRLNAVAREMGLKYSTLIDKLHKAGIVLNRKVLANMAVSEPESFKAIVEKIK